MKSGFHLPVGESENKLEKACVQEITGSKWLKEEPQAAQVPAGEGKSHPGGTEVF